MRRPFRPARKVIDPQGQEWELYVSRVVLPGWKEGGYNGLVDNSSPGDGEAFLLEIPFALVGFLWSSILLPLLRFLCFTPFAIIRGRRSKSARIEAMCLYPEPETRTWTTTCDQANSVLNQIALGLEEGKVVQPIGAFYSGSHQG
jgi:hypothetical protein